MVISGGDALEARLLDSHVGQLSISNPNISKTIHRGATHCSEYKLVHADVLVFMLCCPPPLVSEIAACLVFQSMV